MKTSFSSPIRLSTTVILTFFLSASVANQDRTIWVLVETEALVLTVMRGNKPIEVFKNIAIGRNGAGHNKRIGDDMTPLGSYRIGWINRKSRYRRFFGLNYPSMADGKRALKAHAIDLEKFKELVKADIFEQVPPQNTVLGGQIGIHGLGLGDRRIHNMMNWTHGCIAVTNQQIDRLSHWLKEGVVVQIQ